MTTYAIVNSKPGSAKTTTAGYLLRALPGPVLGVDADPPASLLAWSELGEWETTVVGMPTSDLHKKLPGLSGDVRSVVIDTPPLEDRTPVVVSALRVADIAVIPIAPSAIEVNRITPILDTIENVNAIRTTPLIVRALLTRTVHHARSTTATREVLEESGVHVLDTTIPSLQRYAMAFGKPLTYDQPYEAVAEELENLR